MKIDHNAHIRDGVNKDLMFRTREQYLEATQDWVDPFGTPVVTQQDGFNIVRDDLLGNGLGTKTRSADRLIRDAKENILVYVGQRTGLAGMSIIELANRYDKKVVFFSPACKKMSLHQQVCIERGANSMFLRVVAMPNLNRFAEKWCNENNALFLPPGMACESTTESLVRIGDNFVKEYGHPEEMWVTTSTGALTRGLQIAMPNTRFISLAVARNMKAGECGRADIMTDPKEYNTPEKAEFLPPFPTVKNYEGKMWKFIQEFGTPGAFFWNVGCDPILVNEDLHTKVDSWRDWREVRYGFGAITELHKTLDTTIINSEI